MLLSIISPYEKKSYKVTWLEINTPQGNYVIQPEHAPMIVALSPGQPLTYNINGKEETMLIAQGIIEITRSTATILIGTS